MNKYLKKLNTMMEKDGFYWHTPINICDTKSNTFFVGSSTNVYLPEIIDNTLKKNLYTIQPCLKAHNLNTYDLLCKDKKTFYKSYFKMFGTMKPGALEEKDLNVYFSVFNQFSTLNPNELVILLPKEMEHLETYFENKLCINKVMKTTNERFTKWKYGIDYLSGIGLTGYISNNGTVIQLFDIVEIHDIRNNNKYVEFCFSIDNMKFENESFDFIYNIFNIKSEHLNNMEFIFWDSLVAVCEIFTAGIKLPESGRNNQRSHVLKRYIKYLLASKKKLSYSKEQMEDYIHMYLITKSNYDELNKCELLNIIEKVEINSKRCVKDYERYISKNTNVDIEDVKKRFGVIEI